ncbi:hypothetical protein [Brucella thiophenivorans]|uniref:Uncharacterized protein n=1 Tax=Brucella thiophenivorans TaxID=571255 RepID=A0A256FTS1_9HYPH|nr:hypothetical protein [Brucella thiophenivorans]OYR18275.1 hypothetical protein CEV31_4287 [Brucella thiophenivorans]
MGNWKTTIKVGDLADDQKLELICRKCKRLAYTDRAMLCEKIDRSQLYLDQIESKARCKGRGCNGSMRMSMVRLKEMSGFVGGLA